MPGNGKWWRKGVVAAGVVLVSLMTLSSGRDSVTVRRWLSVACRSITGTSAKAGTFYECNPTYVDPKDDSKAWRFSSPAEQGMDPATLENGLRGLSREKSMLSVLVIRNNRMVAERYFHGGGVRTSNNVHSASKSMIQALVGIAVAKGFIGGLDDKVSKYLPEYFPGTNARKRQISLRDLLTMSSGLAWQEDDTEYMIQERTDWVKAILDQPLRRGPGTVFNYSSGNTHVLSAVLQRATGMSTCEFAARYLFGRIGITVEHWGRDPQGVCSGGYNVYLTSRELAKFGLLYLDRGAWQGQQIVPAAAVEQASQRIWQVDEDFGYSQGWWTRRIAGHDMYLAWGYGGQFIYVIPDVNVVLVTTGDTRDGHVSQDIDLREFIEKSLLPSITRR